MKKIEPAKKTTPSAPGPTSCTNPGNGPMKKHADPMAKPTAIQRSQAVLAKRPVRDGQRMADQDGTRIHREASCGYGRAR